MMAEKNPYELDFEKYIRNTKPAKKDKTYAWTTAIGLQQVDVLTPSKYLFDTAKRNIEGEITFDEAKSLIDTYYESKTERLDTSMGEHNELKNRYCHIRYNEKVAINSDNSSDKVAIKQKSSDIILKYLKDNESINNLKAREITGLSSAGVRIYGNC